MNLVQSVTLREPWDVDRRLMELELGRRFRLITVAEAAVAAGANATAFHPSNASGTFAYQEGTYALREEFVDDNVWRLARPDGVEVIENIERRTRVAFANVDIACDDDRKPRPRSQKGVGAERTCIGNLFGNLPEFAPIQPGGWVTYYLMVDEQGAAELTRPVVKNGTFIAYPERIYLTDGSDKYSVPIDENDDIADDFDPLVIRK